MKKNCVKRGIFGFCMGIGIGHLISIGLSLAWGNGYYSPCEPQLVQSVGNEVLAVLLQAFLCGLLGAGCAAGSVVWELERWSIARQTGVYFLILSVIMLPTAYVLYWMEHSLGGFLGYLGIFVLIFLIMWVVEYNICRYNVKRMNRNLNKIER
ncbi:MAG: DUF3021 domain-containing protein [Lachnospiraceae bacterium]|jgi:hypothetical protein|nr:DUF3021 domain-containing protein [Lachnospiraceae bacterium]MCI8996103.1 DUF3021 domain-containing protein [Lachnospiraceae bacterium]